MTSKFTLTTSAYDICWAGHALSARELMVVKTARLSACVKLCCGVLTVIPVNIQLSRGMPHLACTMDAQYVVVNLTGASVIAVQQDFERRIHVDMIDARCVVTTTSKVATLDSGTLSLKELSTKGVEVCFLIPDSAPFEKVGKI
ncbi:hypothetical protein EGR_10717 [Echinococcus granulosus]|uniref:Uncharacterized protein n=1 Tax=Echinococcus granulosus TaxID=6210 RepID=W6U063_ECHGR|nr:hypothetical protein EGR_10717 [Echinococcus granulosus]EUB54418.1 hypothetical protein EGR_10717 [Echinococcus granulosus]